MSHSGDHLPFEGIRALLRETLRVMSQAISSFRQQVYPSLQRWTKPRA
jgi:hypothetical protein